MRVSWLNEGIWLAPDRYTGGLQSNDEQFWKEYYILANIHKSLCEIGTINVGFKVERDNFADSSVANGHDK